MNIITDKDLAKILPVDEKNIGEGSPEIFNELSNEVVIELQNIMITHFLDKKTQLISFLKGEIGTKEEILEKKQKIDNNYYTIRGEMNECYRILDFVNNGGKK